VRGLVGEVSAIGRAISDLRTDVATIAKSGQALGRQSQELARVVDQLAAASRKLPRSIPRDEAPFSPAPPASGLSDESPHPQTPEDATTDEGLHEPPPIAASSVSRKWSPSVLMAIALGALAGAGMGFGFAVADRPAGPKTPIQLIGCPPIPPTMNSALNDALTRMGDAAGAIEDLIASPPEDSSEITRQLGTLLKNAGDADAKLRLVGGQKINGRTLLNVVHLGLAADLATAINAQEQKLARRSGALSPAEKASLKAIGKSLERYADQFAPQSTCS